MRIHTGRKRLDGAAIAFVVIILLTIVALEILLSRLNAFFEANAMAGEDARPNRSPPFVGAHRADGAGSPPVPGPASSHFSYYRQPRQPKKAIETRSPIVNPFDSQKVETA